MALTKNFHSQSYGHASAQGVQGAEPPAGAAGCCQVRTESVKHNIPFRRSSVNSSLKIYIIIMMDYFKMMMYTFMDSVYLKEIILIVSLEVDFIETKDLDFKLAIMLKRILANFKK